MSRPDCTGHLVSLMRERILILDGAMGTMIQRLGLGEQDFRGSRFASHPRSLAGNNDLLNLTAPEAIGTIHDAYLEAGADIVETNTFNSTPASQGEYGLSHCARDMAREGARIAREACDRAMAKDPSRPRFVAGSVGPTSRTLSISPDMSDPGYRAVSFDFMADSYAECIRGLVEGGADILLVETIFDTLNAKAAVAAIRKVEAESGTHLPLMLSGTIVDAAGRTLSGQTLEAFHHSLAYARPFSMGLNCALGAAELAGHAESLAAIADCAISLHPNAGLPDELGNYLDTPENMARVLSKIAKRSLSVAASGSGRPGGLNIAGGCCGTTPSHIAELARALAGIPPRPLLSAVSGAAALDAGFASHAVGEGRSVTTLAGLELLAIEDTSLFVNIGERTNVAGSRRFARLIREGNYAAAVEIARQQVESGAQLIDVNMDEALLDSREAMGKFLDFVASEPDIARVPVMIDSSDWPTIAEGLKHLQGKGIVNSISLKEGEAVFLEHARQLRDSGAACVVMAFDESGQADTLERRISVCSRAFRLLREHLDFPASDIVMDPNVFAIGTGMEEHRRYALDFIGATAWIRKNLPGVRVSGGISNVSFAFRGNEELRSAIHAVFLYHARRAGLDMGIVNPAQLVPYDGIPDALKTLVEDLVLDRQPDATERLLAYAEARGSGPDSLAAAEGSANGLSSAGGEANGSGTDGTGNQGQAMSPNQSLSPDERIAQALVAGRDEVLVREVKLLLADGVEPVSIIEGPLMAGMDRVGTFFGEGRMFLPQVVKSARAMKSAVAILTPLMDGGSSAASGSGSKGKRKMVLATVKGDVHDIGKNIVSVVLGCNNYEVIDLGVMTPSTTIVDQAIASGADLVGLSGLITPSLAEMVRVAALMEERGLHIPLLIGGATTNPMHTALKIAPAYSGPVVHVADASLAPGEVERLLNPGRAAERRVELEESHARLRELQRAKVEGTEYVPLAQARGKRHVPAPHRPFRPQESGPAVFRRSIYDLEPYIDWTYFFLAWEMKGRYPEILEDPASGSEARKLLADARAMLRTMEASGIAGALGVWGIFPAASAADDILVYADESRASVKTRIPCLRQQRRKEASGYISLADYVEPEGGADDWIGAFAVTAGHGIRELALRLRDSGDEYGSILVKILADRLAEAAAEALHEEVRKLRWACAPEESLSSRELLAGHYQGIRPAPGYPPCPDHREKRLIFDLLDAPSAIGVTLTESCMMDPAASVSGWYFAHPDARYFAVGKILRDQVEDLARRRNETVAVTEQWLATELAYEPGAAEVPV